MHASLSHDSTKTHTQKVYKHIYVYIIHTHSLCSTGGMEPSLPTLPHPGRSLKTPKTTEKAANAHTPPLATSKKQTTVLICCEHLGFRDHKQEKDSFFSHCFHLTALAWSKHLSLSQPLHTWALHKHTCTHTHLPSWQPIKAFRPIWQDSQKCCSQTWVASVTLSGGQT